MFLALEVEEGDTSQETVTSSIWKVQRNGLSPRTSGRNTARPAPRGVPSGLPRPFRMVSSIPGLHSLDTVATTHPVSQTAPNSPVGQNVPPAPPPWSSSSQQHKRSVRSSRGPRLGAGACHGYVVLLSKTSSMEDKSQQGAGHLLTSHMGGNVSTGR